MKRKPLYTSGAIIAAAASLLTAAPSQAAVSLPAGCTTDSAYTTVAEIYSLSCANLAEGTDVTAYTGLGSLTLGPMNAPSTLTLTRLPALPAGVTSLSVNGNTITNFDSLAGLPSLQWLSVTGSTVTNLPAIATHKSLTGLMLDGPGYWGMNLSPLAQLPNLELLSISGTTPKPLYANEGVWTAADFGRGLDGQYLLPPNADVVNEAGKVIGKEYQFDAATRKVKFAGGSIQMQTVRQSVAPKIALMPKLTRYSLWLGRKLDVAAQAEWTREKTNVLVVSGALKVGSILTAHNKYGSGLRDYADKFQWSATAETSAVPRARPTGWQQQTSAMPSA